MTINLDKKWHDEEDSLGELLTKTVSRMSGHTDSGNQEARRVVEFATRAVCEAIIHKGDSFPFWELPERLHVVIREMILSHKINDWWKESRGSRN